MTEGRAEWKAAGISHLMVGRARTPRKRSTPFRPPSTPGLGILLIDDLMCIGLYRESPREMIQLCRDYRVMQKPSINIPSTLLPDLRVDIIRVDWKKVAVQIAGDALRDHWRQQPAQ